MIAVIAERLAQTISAERNATGKPRFETVAKTSKNDIVKLRARGKTTVACDAVSGDWLRPMKRNETIETAGSPPTRPPSALPYLSATSVAELTHAPPTMNARIR